MHTLWYLLLWLVSFAPILAVAWRAWRWLGQPAPKVAEPLPTHLHFQAENGAYVVLPIGQAAVEYLDSKGVSVIFGQSEWKAQAGSVKTGDSQAPVRVSDVADVLYGNYPSKPNKE